MVDMVTNGQESVVVTVPELWAAPRLGAASRKYAVEVIGTFFLVFTVSVSVLSHSTFTPLAAGAALMVMVYAGGHISGGHYNPAVTLAALWRRRIGLADAVGYWIAQLAAALIAAVLARALVHPATVKTLTLSGGALTAAAVALGAATAGLFAWSTLWVYIVVQAVAGAAAGLAFLALNPDDK